MYYLTLEVCVSVVYSCFALSFLLTYNKTLLKLEVYNANYVVYSCIFRLVNSHAWFLHSLLGKPGTVTPPPPPQFCPKKNNINFPTWVSTEAQVKTLDTV